MDGAGAGFQLDSSWIRGNFCLLFSPLPNGPWQLLRFVFGRLLTFFALLCGGRYELRVRLSGFRQLHLPCCLPERRWRFLCASAAV